MIQIWTVITVIQQMMMFIQIRSSYQWSLNQLIKKWATKTGTIWSDSRTVSLQIKISMVDKIITRGRAKLMRSWIFKLWEFQCLKGKELMVQQFKTIRKVICLMRKEVQSQKSIMLRKPRKRWKLTLNNH